LDILKDSGFIVKSSPLSHRPQFHDWKKRRQKIPLSTASINHTVN